jgi:hypothetical protein
MPTGVIHSHRDIAWLLLMAVATWVVCDSTYRAFRDDVFRPLRYTGRQPRYRRKDEPVRYWLSMLGAGTVGLACLVATLYFASLVILDFR